MSPGDDTRVNNSFYGALGNRWYDAQDDPIALLRAEAELRRPWLSGIIQQELGEGRKAVLDLGCGAGFLSNRLAADGHRVTGVDADEEVLEVARAHDVARSVRYLRGDARSVDLPAGSFDVVCAMDFLEHVPDPSAVVARAASALRPGGLFAFHTFSRNWLSWLVVIKGVEWFVKNTPRDMHELALFINPDELSALCAGVGLRVRELRGVRPAVASRAFWSLLATGVVPNDFRFIFCKSTRLGYSGYAKKVG